jgi:hypothetical protein
MKIWRYRLSKLATLGTSDLIALFQAQWLLVWASILLRFAPRGRLLRAPTSPAVAGECTGSEAILAQRLALAVSRAAEHGLFRPACLVRALALDRLLRGRGIDTGQIRIGVRMRAGDFAAHAWVELGDLILGDEEWHVRTFTPVTDLYPAGL